MEGLNPPLKCLIEIQAAVSNAETVRVGLARYLQYAGGDEVLARDIRKFLFAWDQGQDWRQIANSIQSPHRRALLELAATALAGQPILTHLEELRQELLAATDAEIGRYLELLPIRMLIPLLLFQFPAFLMLLFGPLLMKLLEELNR